MQAPKFLVNTLRGKTPQTPKKIKKKSPYLGFQGGVAPLCNESSFSELSLTRLPIWSKLTTDCKINEPILYNNNTVCAGLRPRPRLPKNGIHF